MNPQDINQGQCRQPEEILYLQGRKGLKKPEELTGLEQQMKEEMQEWLSTLDRYNDLGVDPEDTWPI